MGSGASSSNSEAKEKKKFNQTYTLQKELGSGAFSVVKLGVNKNTSERTAVKIVNKKKLSAEDIESLATEIDILGSLNHPHIIKLIETFEEGNDYYIITELVEGGELFDRIVSKTHYTEKEARDLIKMFLETINYMHNCGIVHRDLKPENLLLVSEHSDSDIKLCDFGFAKRISLFRPEESACGTPGYVAPEILRGDSYGSEVDIWSMGVICYVLLVGYPPFYDDCQLKLFKKIKDGRYYFHDEYWRNVSKEAMDLITKMLCVDQKQRWSANQLLNHSWIQSCDETLLNKDLSNSIVTLKKYNIRRKFKAAADAVIISNRLNKAMSKFRVSAIDLQVAKDADEVILEDSHDAPPIFK